MHSHMPFFQVHVDGEFTILDPDDCNNIMSSHLSFFDTLVDSQDNSWLMLLWWIIWMDRLL